MLDEGMAVAGVGGQGGQLMGSLGSGGTGHHQPTTQQPLTFYQNMPMTSTTAQKDGEKSQQAQIQGRRDRARYLLEQICRLRKPQCYENMNAMTDSKRIF